MQLNDFYRVIIVGAGPSGLSTALNLLEYGVDDILVIEKSRFPRYKCCAGYLTSKTKEEYKKAGLDVDGCNYSLIKDFNIVYKNKNRLKINNKFLYTNRNIDRVELDNAFYELAVSKGVAVAENTVITGHDTKSDALILKGGRRIGYGYLVFADGTTGFGSRYRKNKKRNIAMQMTFESDRPQSIEIHFGVTKRGYAWVSSYEGITNVGLTDVFTCKRDYKKIFSGFLAEQGFEVGTDNLKSAFTPIGAGQPFYGKNVMFAGDAVGACDPLTLSGLRYGLSSGKYCAKAIALGKPSVYKKYVRGLKLKFGAMRLMQKIFYLKFALFITFNVFCRFFGGFVSRVFNNFFVNKK